MELQTQATADELLEAMEEFNIACAKITPKQARLLKLLSAGEPRHAAVKAAGYNAKDPGDILNAFRKSPRFAAALKAAYKLHALNFGLPAAWKREQLVEIILNKKDTMPTAAIAALRLLAELDRDLDTPLIQITEDNRTVHITAESLAALAEQVLAGKGRMLEHKP